MRIPVYEGDRCIVPVTRIENHKPYAVPVKVIKPIAIIEIKSNGLNLLAISRWQLLKMLVLSFF